MRSPYPEFVLTNIICIEKDLKGTEIVFAKPRFYFNLLWAVEGHPRFRKWEEVHLC